MDRQVDGPSNGGRMNKQIGGQTDRQIDRQIKVGVYNIDDGF